MNNKSVTQVFGYVSLSENAIYSSHEIARHWLSMDDFKVQEGMDGFYFEDDRLPKPSVPFIPAVLTKDEYERRAAIFDGKGRTVRIARSPFFSSSKKKASD